jgi:endonuclease-3
VATSRFEDGATKGPVILNLVKAKTKKRPQRGKRGERETEILRRLKKEYPDPECALLHENPLQLLVATILSAQCTDARVNMVTPTLFQRYRTARDYAASPPGVLEDEIRSTGFFNNKAKSIRGASARIASEFGGRVPETMDELLTLPGVARKTANVVLGTAFGKNEGVVVDTHVHRVSRRLGLTKEDLPAKIERDLMERVPKADWTWFGHALIHHGRRVCKARRPECERCVLNDLCPSSLV